MKLEKDNSIIFLVKNLEERIGLGKFIINDFWDADLCAIGLSDPKKEALLYVSTHNRKSGLYYLSVENINEPGGPTMEFENIDISELESIVREHLKLE